MNIISYYYCLHGHFWSTNLQLFTISFYNLQGFQTKNLSTNLQIYKSTKMPGNKCRFYNECRVKSTIYGCLAFNRLTLKIMELVKSNLRGLYCKILNTAIYFLSTFHSVRSFQKLGLRRNDVDQVLCCWVGYRLGSGLIMITKHDRAWCKLRQLETNELTQLCRNFVLV